MKTLLLGALLASMPFFAKATVLINIDLSDPSHVVFSSSGGTSDFTTVSPHDVYNDGVDLVGFFTSAVANSSASVSGNISAISSTLRPTSESTQFFTSIYYDDYTNGSATAGKDLNFFSTTNTTSPAIQNFISGSTAFTGNATFNFSGLLAYLPGLNASGNILVGYGASINHEALPIGEWKVTAVASAVPETSTYALTMGALVLTGCIVRRRISR